MNTVLYIDELRKKGKINVSKQEDDFQIHHSQEINYLSIRLYFINNTTWPIVKVFLQRSAKHL